MANYIIMILLSIASNLYLIASLHYYVHWRNIQDMAKQERVKGRQSFKLVVNTYIHTKASEHDKDNLK